MLKKRLYFGILIADLAWTTLALLGAYVIRYGANVRWGFDQPVPSAHLLLLTVSLAAWFLLYMTMDLDGFRSGWQLSAVISRTSTGVVLLMIAIVTYGYSTRVYFSRLLLLYFSILLWLGIILIRYATYRLLRSQARTGRTRKVMVIADTGLSREIVYRIGRHPELMYEVVGLLSPFGSTEITNGGSSPATSNGIGSLEVLELLHTLGVQELVVLLKHTPGIELRNFLVRCQEDGMRILLLPQPYELYLSRPKLTEIDGVPLISLERPSFSDTALTVKRLFDVTFSLILLIPAIILLAGFGGMLWVRDRRLLRKDTRCGRLGRLFAMYRLDVETDDGKASDFQKLLRRLSISELPQLLNVFQGQMSLVGPRPEAPERVRYYSEWQKQRLRFPPGMTGLAQVNGLREEHPSEEKTRYDLQYILNWTPALDLVLLLQTMWTLVARFFIRGDKHEPPRANEPVTKDSGLSQRVVGSIGE
jgi:lipopolysaccharide/colanic/teichoic acid biosynthesis glycosyltransferase